MASDSLTRKLTAIVYADVAGYSRLTGEDEEGTHRRVMAMLDYVSGAIRESGGKVLRYAGDAILAEFSSAVGAVHTTVEIQTELASRNTVYADEQKLQIRIGVHIGDVIEDRGEVFGDGVNLAARLEAAAPAGGICISASVHEQIDGKVAVAFESAGVANFKNIANPVQIYHWPALIPHEAIPEPGDGQPEQPDKPSIVVLPFTNMSGDPEQEYFSDGLSEDLTTALAKYRWFSVVARNTAFTYKGQAVDVVDIGRKLGTRYVLEGSVRKSGQRIRVTAQLIDVSDRNHLWAEKYDGDLSDIFDLQDNITRGIVGELTPQFLSAEVQRSRRKDPASVDAWDLVMRGREHLWRVNREDNLKAAGYFRAAIDRAPESGLGYSDLTQACFWQITFGWTADRSATLQEMAELAARAIAADPSDAYSLAAAAIHRIYANRASEGVELARRAITANANLPIAHSAYAYALVWSEDHAQAIKSAEHALRLSPRDPLLASILAILGICYYLGRQYEDAERIARQLILEQPDMPTGYRQLAASLARQGRAPEAAEAVARILELIPGHTATQSAEQMPFACNEKLRKHWVEGLTQAGLPA